MTDQVDLFTNKDELSTDQLLATLTNDIGEQKYTSVDAAVKGLINSQDHIKRIEQENADLRLKASEAVSMQTILDKMSKQPSDSAPEPVLEQTAVPPEQVDVSALIEAALAQRDVQSQAQANTDMVVSKLQDKYGKDAGSHLYSTFGALGLDKEATNDLIQKQPALVLATLGMDKVEPARATPQSMSVSTAAFQESPSPAVGNAFSQQTTSGLTAEWNAHKQLVNEKLGIK